MKTLCIEGWRGVSHSIAMVNQNQILEMLKLPGWRIYHRDAPYYLPHWNRSSFSSGFAPDEQARIDALPDPGDAPVDVCLRIAAPVRAGAPGAARRTCTFIVTEFGLTPTNFDPPTLRPQDLERDGDYVVTPSHWARERLLEWGLAAERVHVVPHGYKTDIFFPMSEAERAQARRGLQIGAEEVVFVNVGVALWNKGIDLLLLAFAHLRTRGLPVRLLIKDHKGLYGIGVEGLFADLVARAPQLQSEVVRQGISVFSESLNLAQLRSLYGLADAYISPYRAEGFNLPVLEAMACGTHAVVTSGGATDDFAAAPLATRLRARLGTAQEAPQVPGRFLVPDFDDLVHAMEQVAAHRMPSQQDCAQARAALAQSHSWERVTGTLMDLLGSR